MKLARAARMAAVIMLSLGVLGVYGTPPGASAQTTTTLSELADVCEANVDADGLGVVQVNSPVVATDEVVDIDGPCQILLGPAGALRIEGVTLTSDRLLIRDDDSPGANRVEILNSTLTGRSGRLTITLFDSTDSVQIAGSTLDYPTAVNVRVGAVRDEDYGGGVIEVSSSTIRARGPDSEGIQLLASDIGGGIARFVDVTLETPGDEPRLLLADNCQSTNVDGAPADCEPYFAELCSIVGTEGADLLVGTAGDDTICGLGGLDIVMGRGGEDTIVGALGSDILFGGAGSDLLEGGDGADLLTGGEGDDMIEGGFGSDVLLGNTGADTLIGGPGPDILVGGPGEDIEQQ